MFFAQSRIQFFKPLTGKYREQVAECLKLLYTRLYSAEADYGESLRREQVIDIFAEALTRAPLLEDDEQPEPSRRFKNEREQAGWILNLLVEHGWLEKQVDQATFQSTYPFSRAGRMFTHPLLESDSNRIRTRHRNTRNTLNALEAFASRGEVHDLLDAYEYSERIIADFTDMIAELEERTRELVQEVESQILVQEATEQFFDFMENRFKPDLSIRLSADSVEKHRDDIQRTISRIRRKRNEFKADAERRLRELAPQLVRGNRSVLWHILDTIENRMRNAAEIMLPALRKALLNFTKRADIIIRQLTYLAANQKTDVVTLCKQLSQHGVEQQQQHLEQLGSALAGIQFAFPDPQQIKLQQKRERQVVQTAIQQQQPLDQEAHKALYLQHMLDQAFNLNQQALRDYIEQSLLNNHDKNSNGIRASELPINNAKDLLAMSHIIEMASNPSAEGPQLQIKETGNVNKDHPYFSAMDDFIIEWTDNQS